jgi:IS5 family transposase
MRIFEDFKLYFEEANWKNDPELALVDSILQSHSELIALVNQDIDKGDRQNQLGRKDTPSVEQIMRAAIYKELKGLEYRELFYHQEDSRICARFVKIDEKRPFSFQLYQKYISKISEETLQEILFRINNIAVNEGLEDMKRIRQDTTTVESNIHYPTNNSLIWDCIRRSNNLLEKLSNEVNGFNYRDYTKGAKRTYFKINNAPRNTERKTALFHKQLSTFTKSINQVSNVVKKKQFCGDSMKVLGLLFTLEELLGQMYQVYDVAYRKELKGEKVPNEEKIFSIFEPHTDIIVKGGREVVFGHKVNLVSGKSNLILHCDILKGNPSDSGLYQSATKAVIQNYGITPRDSVGDGGFASKENVKFAKSEGIINVVFNKIKGSLQNIATSDNMETRLKKWRSGIEAVISNFKRGFNLTRCEWKGQRHFSRKILWSVIGYNIRVLSRLLIGKMALE